MTDLKDPRSAGVAVGGLLVLFGGWLLLRTTGIVPAFVFEMLDRISGPVALIAVGVVIVVLAQRAHAPTPGARLYRSRGDRWLGGVFGGLGPYLGVDPVVLRLAAIVLVVTGQGWMVVGYLIAWAVIPEQPAAPAPPA